MYRDYLHGEVVSVGMMGAAGIGERAGVHDSELVARRADVPRALGLEGSALRRPELRSNGPEPCRSREALLTTDAASEQPMPQLWFGPACCRTGAA